MSVCVKDERITDFFTERGNCMGCGECCGRFLPLTVLDIARLKSYVERNGIEVSREAWIDGDGLTLNFNCPFLDEDRECMVYEARPEMCRAYRCDMHRKGTLPVHEWMRGAVPMDMREVFA